jgi:putative ABC transport system permease protein
LLVAEHLREAWQTLRRDRLRTVLTGSSVAWGVFLTVLLLGAATGLRNGVAFQFRSQVVDAVWISGRHTTVPYGGVPVGTAVELSHADAAQLATANPAAHVVTAARNLSRTERVAYRGRQSTFQVRAVEPAYRALDRSRMVAGRFVSDLDLHRGARVAVIGVDAAAFLFGHQSVVGKSVQIGPLTYRIIGMFTDDDARKARTLYIPLSTAQRLYGNKDAVDTIAYSIDPSAAAAGVDGWREVQRFLASRHHFSPSDERALRVQNVFRQFRRLQDVLALLTVFVWGVGLLTMAAGMIGVSNIVFISVNERMRELALRKALGASPGSVFGLVIRESLLLSGFSGMVGLGAGVGLLAIVGTVVPPLDTFREPAILASHAFGIAFAVVSCGVLAGLIPASRAARLRPAAILKAER